MYNKIVLYAEDDSENRENYDEFEDETHAQKLTQLAYRLNKKILKETEFDESIIQASYSFGYKIIIE